MFIRMATATTSGIFRRGNIGGVVASPAHEKAVEVLFETMEGKAIVVLSQSGEGIRLP